MMALLLLGLSIEAGVAALAFLGDLRQHLFVFLGIYALLCTLAWVAYRICRKETSAQKSWLIIFFAVLFRLTLLPVTPSLTDDIYRYIWEGKVQQAGFSPYEFPPSAPELAGLRDSWYEKVNHKDIPTIYPPLVQAAFRSAHWIGQRVGRPVTAQKAFFLGCDLLTLIILWRFLSERGAEPAAWMIYAWNPLVILEIAGSGHNDALGILWLVTGLLCLDRGRTLQAGFAWGLSFLSKYVPVLLLPWMLFRRQWKLAAVIAVVSVIGMIPFCACWMMTSGVKQYAARWQFNGSLYPLILFVLRSDALAKWGIAAALGIFALLTGWREKDSARALLFVSAASLFLAPTVHPWYFLWVIPLLCLFPSPGLLVWNLTIVFSYTVHRRYNLYGVWDLHPVVQGIEYAPVFILLVWEWIQRRGAPLCALSTP